jgi:hypothetical protein
LFSVNTLKADGTVDVGHSSAHSHPCH